MRTVQIIADDFEALFLIDDNLTDEEVKTFYKEFEESEYDDFEDFMNDVYSNIGFERMFVDEIYV